MENNSITGFDLRGHLKNEKQRQTDLEAVKSQENTSEGNTEKLREAPKVNKEVEKVPEKSKKDKTITNLAITNTGDEKIAFMNYLPTDVHEDFEYVFLEAKKAMRLKTKKALSKTELVEAILRNAIAKWQNGEREEILETAEKVINHRKGKE